MGLANPLGEAECAVEEPQGEATEDVVPQRGGVQQRHPQEDQAEVVGVVEPLEAVPPHPVEGENEDEHHCHPPCEDHGGDGEVVGVVLHGDREDVVGEAAGLPVRVELLRIVVLEHLPEQELVHRGSNEDAVPQPAVDLHPRPRDPEDHAPQGGAREGEEEEGEEEGRELPQRPCPLLNGLHPGHAHELVHLEPVPHPPEDQCSQADAQPELTKGEPCDAEVGEPVKPGDALGEHAAEGDDVQEGVVDEDVHPELRVHRSSIVQVGNMDVDRRPVRPVARLRDVALDRPSQVSGVLAAPAELIPQVREDHGEGDDRGEVGHKEDH
eukprot:Sspe_Gene.3090::Locus_1019_Transcript_1_1_Confidence_1.000_Length_2375::g.3090::m.3090